MPVIQLPKDDRWGQVGQGISSAVTALAGAWQQKKIDEGVAQVIQDDTVPTDKKLPTVLERFGSLGVTSLTNQIKAQLAQQQIGLVGAETGVQQQTQQKLQQANALQRVQQPDLIAQLKAENEATRMKTALTGAQTQLTGAETAATRQKTLLEGEAGPAKVGVLEAERDFHRAQADKLSAETSILADEQKFRAALMSDPQALDKQLEAQGIVDPAEQARVRSAVMTGGTKAGQTVLNQISQNHARVQASKAAADVRNQEPKQTPQQQIAAASTSMELAKSTGNFLESMKRSGESSGTTSGAPLKAWLEKHGFATGDPNVLSMYENQMQAIQQKATSGGGFFAQGRVKLASDVTPNLWKSPLANIMSADAVADQQLANLRTQKSGLLPSQNQAPLDTAIGEWEKIKSRTGSLESYVTKDGKSIVFFEGNQIDPKNMKAVIEADKDYSVGKRSITGADVIAAAKKYNISPQELIAGLKASNGQ